MGYFDSLLHPENAYKEAQKQREKYYQEAMGYLNPLMEHGEAAYELLSPEMMRLLNPMELQNEWIEGYETSPYALNEAQVAREQGGNALQSMGLMGSTPGAKAVTSATTDIIMRDRQKYLDDIMQKYMTGLNLTSGFYNTGANARTNASNAAMNMGDESATNAANQYSAQGRLMGNLLGTGATLGAFALGGPTAGMSMDRMNPWSTTGGQKTVGNQPVIPNPFR